MKQEAKRSPNKELKIFESQNKEKKIKKQKKENL